MSDGFNPELIVRNKSATARAYSLLDKIGNAWRDAEEFFRSQGVLRSVELPIRPIKEPQTGKEIGEECIGIQKMGGAWRICVGARFRAFPDGDREWKPVGDASVQVRIGLIHYIYALFAAVVESNESCAEEIEDATFEMDRVLNDLRIPHAESE